MTELPARLAQLQNDTSTAKMTFVNNVADAIKKADYTIWERNDQKPWGAYLRINSNEVDRFLADFFPKLTLEEVRLGIEDAELSPKLLVVAPGQRLSWQYHNRRAERWTFLTNGAYNKSMTDEEAEVIPANVGDEVQFSQGERHRLIGALNEYTMVAEIWQHADPLSPSDESDIVRLADDYSR